MHGRCSAAASPRSSRWQEAVDRAQRPLPQLLDPAQLLADVRHHLLRRVRRRRGAQIGDQVQQRGVRLMADRRDDRRTAARTARTSCSSENGSRSSTLPPPRATMITSTSGSASSSWTAATTCGTAWTPCTGTLRTAKRTAGQRCLAFSRTSRSAALARPQTSPISCGRNGSGLLRSGREQPLRRQRLLQLLQPGEEFTDADRLDLGGPQRQLAARGVPLRLGVHHHPGALAHHVGDLVEDLAVARHAHRDVVRRVTQRQKDHARAGAPRELGDLPLDPHRAEPVDPTADEPGHLADRDRRFRGRRNSHTSETNGGH